MPVKYCSNCGSKITFELKAPENCPKCGKAVNSALKTVSVGYVSTTNPTCTHKSVDLSNLEESDEIDFNLIDQIKSSLTRTLSNMDITVEQIPEFRVPLNQIINTKE